jgi:hypothetical protein
VIRFEGVIRILLLLSTDDILATPFVLIGTIEQMAEQILGNRERYGLHRPRPLRRHVRSDHRARTHHQRLTTPTFSATDTIASHREP